MNQEILNLKCEEFSKNDKDFRHRYQGMYFKHSFQSMILEHPQVDKIIISNKQLYDISQGEKDLLERLISIKLLFKDSGTNEIAKLYHKLNGGGFDIINHKYYILDKEIDYVINDNLYDRRIIGIKGDCKDYEIEFIYQIY